MKKRDCERCEKREDGNCPLLGLDNFPIQCVGAWAEDKYYFLERYLNATCEARRKFSIKGNAVFIDLFSGPGRCIIKNEQKEIDGGGLRVALREEAPFNELYYFDIINSNVDAMKQRLSAVKNCYIKCGDVNILIKDLVSSLRKKEYRYHFAFIDPFGPDGIDFLTLKELATLKRMDLLIHFPIGAIKRNLPNWKKSSNTILDKFLGTDAWRDRIQAKSPSGVYSILLEIFKQQLMTIGYPAEGLMVTSPDGSGYSSLPAVSVKNTKDVDLYVLILAAKNPLAQKIWTNIIKKGPDGQKTFF